MRDQTGYTLIETVVSISLFVVALLMVTSIYNFVQTTYRTGNDKAEVLQNARVALDRMSREIRQAVDYVGDLPVAYEYATSSLEFQDGHDQESLEYIRYRLDGSNLIREIRYYYFPIDPATRVLWNRLDAFGNYPISTTSSANTIGEYFNSIKFFKSTSSIDVEVAIKKNNSDFKMRSNLFFRN